MADLVTNTPSSLADPTQLLGNLQGLIRFVLTKFAMTEIDACMPAVVVATDGRKVATVRPLVKMVGTDGKTMSRATIAEVPIFQLGAGGYILSFPVKAGDVGFLFAADRDIAAVVAAGMKEQAPGSERFHDFRDGIFFPSQSLNTAVSGPADAVCLQSDDGTIAVRVSSAGVTVKHPVKVVLQTPAVECSGKVWATDFLFGQTNTSVATHTHPYINGTTPATTSLPTPTPGPPPP